MNTTSPASLIQQQLDAYNAKDPEAWLATYAQDAEQYLLHGDLLAKGQIQMRERMAARFTEPDLYAQLLSRSVMGHIVIDLERVTRNFPEGKGSMEVLCIYEVKDQKICKASFAFGEKILHPQTA
jgi:hypothetical protein